MVMSSIARSTPADPQRFRAGLEVAPGDERSFIWMASTTTRTVAVWPAAARLARPRLFAALEEAFPVRFASCAPAAPGVVAVLAFLAETHRGVPDELAGVRVPVLMVADGDAAGSPVDDVVLADGPGVDPRLRAATIRDRRVGAPPGAEGGDAVLAGSAAGPVWVRSAGAVRREIVGAALPELAADEPLHHHVYEHATASVALLQLLRSLTDADAWRPPPLRAAFVFDDPNVRWSSYGFIDYRRLVAHADTHGYHAAMAMIPLDAGRPHPTTAALFARRRDRLSLVVHGNDHIKRELLRQADPGRALRTAAQAVRRVAGFERRWGLHVDRVMMPPHGMCSEPMTRALAAVGFDALCAIHPLPWAHRTPAEPPLAAWPPAQFVAGCAVIPRIHLDSSDAAIALRAFLGHPLVLYGHHDDLAHGLDALAEAARRVNRLGDVRWGPLEEIALTNYEWSRAGERMLVSPYARRVRVKPAAGTSSLGVVVPRGAHGDLELVGWSVDGRPVRPFGEVVELGSDEARVVRLHGVGDVDAAAVPSPPWRPWPRLRRAGTEARDRLLPLRAALAR
jgi:hypothetical protein